MSEYFRKPIVKTLMLKGQEGQSIKSIKKTGTNGLVDTYTVTLTDGDTTTFKVTNGKSIVDIKKTGSTGLVDTYTTTYNDGTTSTFSITNGKGISSIKKTGTNGLVDTYTTTYNDGTTSTFTVTNGEGVQNLQVGGRNLLINSASYDDRKVAVYDTAQNTEKINVVPGEKIVVSFDVKSETPQTKAHTALMQYYDSSGARMEEFNFYIDGNVKTEYTRLSYSDTVPDNAATFILGLRSGSGVENTYAKIKIERGNVATDWTPAPEDLETTAITNAEIDNIVK